MTPFSFALRSDLFHIESGEVDGIGGIMGDYPGELLQKAAIHDCVDLLIDILQNEEGKNINCVDSFGRTPLYTAVSHGSLRSAQILLQWGGDANIAGGLGCDGMSPLHVAVKNDAEAMVDMLLKHGADASSRDSAGRTAVQLAMLKSEGKCAEIILQHMGEKKRWQNDEEKDLYMYCLNGDTEKATTVASQMDPNVIQKIVNLVSQDQYTLLHKSCEVGQASMVQFLLSHRADIRVLPVDGMTPLHIACSRGHAECVKLLLNHCPDLVAMPSTDGTLPLHLACAGGCEDVVQVLLDYSYPKSLLKKFSGPNGVGAYSLGLDLNAPDGLGRRPLHWSAIANHRQIAELLVNFRVPVLSMPALQRLDDNSSVSIDGDSSEIHTPVTVEVFAERSVSSSSTDSGLSSAESVLNTEPVSRQNSNLTIEIHPIEIDVLDHEGNTPLHLALLGNGQSSYFQVALLLLQRGADPNRSLFYGSISTRPLMVVCSMPDAAALDLLLRYGVLDYNNDALNMALQMQAYDLVRILLKYQTHLDFDTKTLSRSESKKFPKKPIGEINLENLSMLQTPLVINWHGLQLPLVKMEWLSEACNYHFNKPKCDLPINVFELVTIIDLSGNCLKQIPDELVMLCTQLRSLRLNGNQLEVLPSASKFSFELIHEELFVSSKSLWQCNLLVDLSVQKNQLATLPADVFLLPNLKKLLASSNCITELPVELWQNEKLEEIDLSYNKLTALPAWSEDCHPDGAHIMPGCLSQIPDTSYLSSYSSSVGQYGSQPNTPIKKFNFQSGVGEINVINSMDSFVTLTGPDSNCQYLPINCIAQWNTTLQVENRLEDNFDMESSNVSSRLVDLNISHNCLTCLPPSLACLAPKLARLNASYNSLSTLGPVCQLPAGIKYLDLSHNNISDISASSVSDVGNVELSPSNGCKSPFVQKSRQKKRNSLSSAGQSFTRKESATSLDSLALSSNPLHCHHHSHQQLSRLRILKLSYNVMSSLTLLVDFPNSANCSSALDSPRSTLESRQRRSLNPNVRNNSQFDVDNRPQPLLLFPALTTLEIGHNKLTSLPSAIGLLNHLAELKINHNTSLKELAPELSQLKKLWNLDYSGCEAESVLHSVLGEKARKTSAVLSYLKSIRDEAVPYNRMKLMLVGIQGIGKTSLLNQLRRFGQVTSESKHWAERMGHVGVKSKDMKGENLSTVGVDIDSLTFQHDKQEIVFSTWDFGGQREYYATHQYFLSKRSLYLVVWKITDGEKGINELHQWLITIQARAPNSPVIIVGTHLDKVVRKDFPDSYLTHMRQLLRSRYLDSVEREKSGLPKIVGFVEVSCKASFGRTSGLSELYEMIINTVLTETGSGTERLLEQKIPAMYLRLQSVIEALAKERIKEGKDPVLHAEQYKPLVSNKMDEMFQKSFRDIVELNQATQFLHDNGVILHYDDASLCDIYFLDPQWLCDVLANVVTIPEINRLAVRGVMLADDVKVLFKSTAFKPDNIRSYIINLLSKFEVALIWSDKLLLIPSMLPTERDIKRSISQPSAFSAMVRTSGNLKHALPTTRLRKEPMPRTENSDNTQIASSISMNLNADVHAKSTDFQAKRLSNLTMSFTRLYLMSYFPCGFWPRLITRLLADSSLYETAFKLYGELEASYQNAWQELNSIPPEWHCWQTGLELCVCNGSIPVARVKEVQMIDEVSGGLCDYTRCDLLVTTDTAATWQSVHVSALSVLEVVVWNEVLELTCVKEEDPKPTENMCAKTDLPSTQSNARTLCYPNRQNVAALLTEIIHHIDLLLEDWYPNLGQRFEQTSRGHYLVTRLVPCNHCLFAAVKDHEKQQAQRSLQNEWSLVENQDTESPIVVSPTIPSADVNSKKTNSIQTDKLRSQNINFFLSTCVLPNTTSHLIDRCEQVTEDTEPLIYCSLIEHCYQTAQSGSGNVVYCRTHGVLGPYWVIDNHGVISLGHIAPDALLQDVPAQYIVFEDQLTRGHFLGKGAFGAVFAGSLFSKVDNGKKVEVAIKMLEPVDPGDGASETDKQQYEIDKRHWSQELLKCACEAYLSLRKELSILLALHHPHIVPLVGVCLHPLSIILSLAPLGSLRSCLDNYRRLSHAFPSYAIRCVIIQVSSALQYLHSRQIIYRDLKSENVLVWSLPNPYDTNFVPVDVKLADYGVSRCVLSSSAKGMAGTLPFIAPEIIMHNGEEIYTEKVDCFSFGMFIYEMLTQKMPFDGEHTLLIDGNVRCHLLAGKRPTISSQELDYSCYLLNLMTMCWSKMPADRPSAGQIHAIASKPGFCELQTVARLQSQYISCACVTVEIGDDFAVNKSQIWLASKSGTNDSHIDIYTVDEGQLVSAKRIPVDFITTCMCSVNQNVWCGDDKGCIHIYSAINCNEVLRFNASSRSNVTMKMIAYAAAEKQVYVVASGGVLIACSSTLPALIDANFIPQKREFPGQGRVIYSLAIIPSTNGSSELWCGQGEGRLSVLNLHPSEGKLYSLSHKVTKGDVIFVVTQPYTTTKSVWTYMYPGTQLFRWDVTTKTVAATADLQSCLFQIPDYSSCQVTSICPCDNELYVGTTLGYIFVFQSYSLKPITAVRCHGSNSPYIQTLLYVSDSKTTKLSASASSDERQSSLTHVNSLTSEKSFVISVGAGYYDLIASEVQEMQEIQNALNTECNFMLVLRTGLWMECGGVDKTKIASAS